MLKLIFIYFVSLYSLSTASDNCEEWFSRLNLKPGPNCLTDCAIADTDMSSFECPNRCHNLCESNIKEASGFALAYLYPGLTAAERALIVKFPSEANKDMRKLRTQNEYANKNI